MWWQLYGNYIMATEKPNPDKRRTLIEEERGTVFGKGGNFTLICDKWSERSIRLQYMVNDAHPSQLRMEA